MSTNEQGTYIYTSTRYGPHDCLTAGCDTDTRSPGEIESDGFDAGEAGASYEDCPYGHWHPDVRFTPWQTGRWKARQEWCWEHGKPGTWCETDRLVSEGDEQPCRMTSCTHDVRHASTGRCTRCGQNGGTR